MLYWNCCIYRTWIMKKNRIKNLNIMQRCKLHTESQECRIVQTIISAVTGQFSFLKGLSGSLLTPCHQKCVFTNGWRYEAHDLQQLSVTQESSGPSQTDKLLWMFYEWGPWFILDINHLAPWEYVHLTVTPLIYASYEMIAKKRAYYISKMTKSERHTIHSPCAMSGELHVMKLLFPPVAVMK